MRTSTCVPVVAVLAILVGGSPVEAQTPGARFDEAQTPGVKAAAPDAAGLSTAKLLRDLVADFRRLPSTDTVTWLGVGALGALAAHPFDGSSSASMSASRPLDLVFEPGETLGGAAVQIAGAVAVYAAGRATGHGRVASLGADLIRAQMMSQALTTGIKVSVRRVRPDGTPYSFPSGHTSVTFASATVLHRHLGWKVGVPAFAVASYVAASRIQEGRHFLSDVAFGAAVGLVAGRTVTVGRGSARFALAPMAAQGGAGVAFNWVGAP